MSGYFTVASSLTDHWRQHGPLTPSQLRDMTAPDCAAIFGQSLDDPAIAELMELFAQALRDLGDWLQTYDDKPLAPFAFSGGSAERLIGQLAAMPLFRDVAEYHGQSVPLYKRAQLLTADMALAFDQQGPGAFHDLDDLTIFADNLVPHVLRLDGALRYDDRLAAQIDAGELLPPGSQEEREIRACALHACERIAARLDVPPRTLDTWLWDRGQAPRYKAAPRHRTRTVYY